MTHAFAGLAGFRAQIERAHFGIGHDLEQSFAKAERSHHPRETIDRAAFARFHADQGGTSDPRQFGQFGLFEIARNAVSFELLTEVSKQGDQWSLIGWVIRIHFRDFNRRITVWVSILILYILNNYVSISNHKAVNSI